MFLRVLSRPINKQFGYTYPQLDLAEKSLLIEWACANESVVVWEGRGWGPLFMASRLVTCCAYWLSRFQFCSRGMMIGFLG